MLGIIWLIIILLYLIYAIWFCRWLHFAFNYKFKYLEKNSNGDLEDIYKPFDRDDFNKLNIDVVLI